MSELEPEPEPEAAPAAVVRERASCGGGFKKTSLMLAARDNTPDVAVMALECSANQQTIDVVDEFGRTALMSAAMHGSDEVVRILLAAGADMEVRDCDGNLALDLAKDALLRQLLVAETERRAAFLAAITGSASGNAHDLEHMLQGLTTGAKTTGGATECPF